MQVLTFCMLMLLLPATGYTAGDDAASNTVNFTVTLTPVTTSEQRLNEMKAPVNIKPDVNKAYWAAHLYLRNKSSISLQFNGTRLNLAPSCSITSKSSTPWFSKNDWQDQINRWLITIPDSSVRDGGYISTNSFLEEVRYTLNSGYPSFTNLYRPYVTVGTMHLDCSASYSSLTASGWGAWGLLRLGTMIAIHSLLVYSIKNLEPNFLNTGQV